MNEILYMILAFIVGIALGMLFFGGLWYTVKKAVTTKLPSLWFFMSFFLRVTVVLIGFYYIAPGGWQPLVISLLGFIVARAVVTQLTKSMDKKQLKTEVYHEA